MTVNLTHVLCVSSQLCVFTPKINFQGKLCLSFLLLHNDIRPTLVTLAFRCQATPWSHKFRTWKTLLLYLTEKYSLWQLKATIFLNIYQIGFTNNRSTFGQLHDRLYHYLHFSNFFVTRCQTIKGFFCITAETSV